MPDTSEWYETHLGETTAVPVDVRSPLNRQLSSFPGLDPRGLLCRESVDRPYSWSDDRYLIAGHSSNGNGIGIIDLHCDDFRSHHASPGHLWIYFGFAFHRVRLLQWMNSRLLDLGYHGELQVPFCSGPQWRRDGPGWVFMGSGVYHFKTCGEASENTFIVESLIGLSGGECLSDGASLLDCLALVECAQYIGSLRLEIHWEMPSTSTPPTRTPRRRSNATGLSVHERNMRLAESALSGVDIAGHGEDPMTQALDRLVRHDAYMLSAMQTIMNGSMAAPSPDSSALDDTPLIQRLEQDEP